MTKTDRQLKQDIETELLWDPRVNASQIGVGVDAGVVSLFGTVDTWPQKWAAEEATKRVAGVRTVAQDMTVKVLAEHASTDTDLAAAVQTALQRDLSVPATIGAEVERGVVTLRGKATWHFERAAAERAVRNLRGVVAVHDSVTLDDRAAGDPSGKPSQVERGVVAALARQSSHHATSIHVKSEGGKVTLTGHVSSWQELGDASTAAWAAPGVTEVVDFLAVVPQP